MSDSSTRKSRRKKSAQVFQYQNDKQKWSNEEKRVLLAAIKRHGLHDTDKLQELVQSRSSKEIESLINGLKRSSGTATKNKQKSPLDKWLNLVSDLVACEDEDYSSVLAQVVAVVSSSEFTEETIKGRNSEEPNYQRIYQYIEALFLGKYNPKFLEPIEAALVLDLMCGLVDKLRSSHVDDVKHLLQWKYSLLSAPVLPNSRKQTKEIIRMALENDFPRPSKDKEVAVSPEVIVYPPYTSTGREETDIVFVRKDLTDACENCESSGESSNKRTLGASSEDIHPKKRCLSEQPDCETASKELSALTKSQCPSQRDRAIQTGQSNKQFQKPALFTLNPLCIPVNLLKLRPVETEREISL